MTTDEQNSQVVPSFEALGVQVYEESQLEKDVLFRANLAYNEQCSQELDALNGRLSNISDDIKYAQSDLERMELELDRMLIEECDNVSDIHHSRKIRSLELETELKMKSIDTLLSRKNAIESKLELLRQYRLQSINNNLTLLPSTSASPVLANKLPGNVTSLELNPEPPAGPRVAKPQRVPVIHARQSRYHRGRRLRTNTEKICRHQRKTFVEDDASMAIYRKRLTEQGRVHLLDDQLAREHDEVPPSELPDEELGSGYRIPGRIWSRLYDYQRLGVHWLWKLHQGCTGGILGDEMGLGKTIQIIAFLAGLLHSHRVHESSTTSRSVVGTNTGFVGSILIICPATLLRQWLEEFREWCPSFRVAILHATGTGYHKPNALIKNIGSHTGSVLLTTYQTMVTFRDQLFRETWAYLILDEGHKIKNPEAEATVTVKRFLTCHRIIVSGSPMQNNLRELWSLFDFICPGRLGPLTEFMQQFAIPITQGGYFSASPLQVETAYRCACTLRDLLLPFLIRRLKADVKIQLPGKSEQVLFCRLTNYQRQLYKEFTESQLCKDLLNGKGLIFPALILLRKLCNHPDLATGGPKDRRMLGEELEEDYPSQEYDVSLNPSPWTQFGCPRRSSKMLVVASLLRTWSEQNHRVLLFSQSRRMLTLLERFIMSLGYSYFRMDGSTPVGQRQKLIKDFNDSVNGPFVFLLTTRVGGLGVNLTAANRVLIYDPDWNPTTDLQARERAWRIGQKRDVLIYRLLTSGTIEEKIYHRQIFKQFLTNRILKNPRQQRFFKTNDLQELLSFDDAVASSSPLCSSSSTPDTALFVNSQGLGHTLSRSILENNERRSLQERKPLASNRFDLLGKKLLRSRKRSHPNKGGSNSDSDSGESQLDAHSSSKSFPDKSQDLSALSPSEKRKLELRSLARRLSRRIAEDNLTSSNQDTALQLSRTFRGTRVDGKRISLVSRRLTYDNGDVDARKKSRRCSPTSRNSATQSSLETKITTTTESDAFLNVLLSRSNNVISSANTTSSRTKESAPTDSQSRLLFIKKQRSLVDDDVRAEAERVANEALKNIRKYDTNVTNSMANAIQFSKMVDMEHSSERSSLRRSSKYRPQVPRPSGSGQVIPPSSSSAPTRKRKSDSTRSTSMLPSHHVTLVVQHDKLLDQLTDHDRVDSSFRRLQMHRTAQAALQRLYDQIFRPQSMELWRMAVGEKHKADYHAFNVFGRIKDHLLWNPHEKLSGTPSGDSWNENRSSVFTTHVRFSSVLLIHLIRKRLTTRANGPIGEGGNDVRFVSGNEVCGTVDDRIAERLAVDLIRCLSRSQSCVTSALLAVEFRSVLPSPSATGTLDLADTSDVKVYGPSLFRALLRLLAERVRPTSTKSLHTRAQDQWILRDRHANLARYLNNNIVECER